MPPIHSPGNRRKFPPPHEFFLAPTLTPDNVFCPAIACESEFVKSHPVLSLAVIFRVLDHPPAFDERRFKPRSRSLDGSHDFRAGSFDDYQKFHDVYRLRATQRYQLKTPK